MTLYLDPALPSRPRLEDLRFPIRSDHEAWIQGSRTIFREHWKPNEIDPLADPRPPAGWMKEKLLETDHLFWGRWDYWAILKLTQKVPRSPIPPIRWECDRPFNGFKNHYIDGGIGHRHLSDCLDLVYNLGHQASWRKKADGALDYFLDWLLYGFSELEERPEEPKGATGAFSRLYQFCNIHIWQAWPWDYFADLLIEIEHADLKGFEPTPPNVTKLAQALLYTPPKVEDPRLHPLYDCCAGTGAMLFRAGANKTLKFAAQEVDWICYRAMIVNAYLYVPWAAIPLPFLWNDD